MTETTLNKYSLAAKKRWANIPAEKRTKRMRKVAKLGWKSKSIEERKARIDLMVKAHKIKAKSRKLSNLEK